MSLRSLPAPRDVVAICLDHWRAAELFRQVFPSDTADRVAVAQRWAYEQARTGRLVLQ